MQTTRRTVLNLGLGIAAGSVLAGEGREVLAGEPAAAGTQPRPGRSIPQQKLARIIVDNDFAGDPDGLVALAHQLLSPTTQVTLVTSLPLNRRFESPALAGRSAAAGAEFARHLLGLVHQPSIPVLAGPENIPAHQAPASPAAGAIVREALRQDSLPLIVTCGGPLTNVATALREEPRIAERMTVIWIGGGAYPAGGWEYNLITDVAAARFVIERSRVPLWQVPLNAYRQMQYSIARMNAVMRTGPELARWLYRRFVHPPEWAKIGGTWPLGDSPLVLLTALSSESSVYEERPAKVILKDGRYGREIPGRSVRVYASVDARLTFEDMEALFALQR